MKARFKLLESASEELPVAYKAAMVYRIMADEVEAIGQFYNHFMPVLRVFFRARRLDRKKVEHFAAETVLTAVRQIQRGSLKNPECLIGYVRMIAQRIYFGYSRELQREHAENLPGEIEDRVADVRKGPEADCMNRERREIALAVLTSMKRHEREILTRFYLWEQDEATIRKEMNLTATQYRLLKSRAKARFGALAGR